MYTLYHSRLRLLWIGVAGALLNAIAIRLAPLPISVSFALLLPATLALGIPAGMVIGLVAALPFLGSPTFVVVLAMNWLLVGYVGWQPTKLRQTFLGGILLIMLTAVWILTFYKQVAHLQDDHARLQTEIFILAECISLGIGILFFSRFSQPRIVYTATLTGLVAAFTALAVVINLFFLKSHPHFFAVGHADWYASYLLFWNILLEGLLAGAILFGLYVDEERERTRQQLIDSEERYRAVSEVMADYAYAIKINLDGTSEIEWITDAITRITGRTIEDAKLSGWQKVIHPDDIAKVTERIKQLVAGEELITDFRIIHKNGQIRWLRDHGRPFKDQTGRVVRIYGAVRDITTSKVVEETFFRTHHTLEALIQFSPLAIVVAEIDTLKVMVWNAAAEKMFGWHAEEVLHQPIPYVPDFKQAEFEAFRAELRMGKTAFRETQRMTKSGKIIDVHISTAPLLDGDQKITHMISIIADISERKKSENNLRQINRELATSRKTLDRLIQQLPIGIQVFAPDGLCIDVNQTHLDIFGVANRDALVDRYNIYDDKMAEILGITQAMWRVKAGEIVELGDIPFDFIHAQPPFGDPQLGQRFINVTLFPVYDDQSQIKNIVGMNIDVTERRRTENLLRQRNQELEALNAIALSVGSTLNMNEVLETVLIRLAELVPYDSASIALVQEGQFQFIAGRGIPEAVNLSEVDTQIQDFTLLNMAVAQRAPLVIGDVQQNPLWVNVSENYYIRSWMAIPLIQRDTVIGILNLDKKEPDFYTPQHAAQAMAIAQQTATAIENARLFTDLEQRVSQRTAELQTQKDQTETILSRIADAIMFADREANILYVNPAWENLLGYQSWEVLGKYPRVLTSGLTAPQTYEDLWATALQGNTWKGVLHDQRKSGEFIDLETTVVPVSDAQGTINRFVAVQRDVTEALRVEKLKTRFVSNASHELRTPLTNLQLRIHLIHKQPEKLEEHLATLEIVVSKMRGLVEDLLDVSRYERGTIPLIYQQVDMVELVEEVALAQQLYAEHKRIHLTTSIPPKPFYNQVDPERLTQVITNLVVNALNYTPEDGVVTLHLRRENETMVIQVEDTGIGIPAHFLPDAIFEPFCRAHETIKGTGLGLTIAREIVRLHNGTLSVQSAVGKGSIFTVSLPLK